MTGREIPAILDAIMGAHGGAEFWRGLSGLEAELSASGFLFIAKRRPPLVHTRVWASTTEPRFVFYDYPRPGLRGELFGDRMVLIRDAAGNVVASREEPRAAFATLRRQLRWDDLDFLYFGGYATWNYLVTPFLLLQPGFAFELLPSVAAEKGRLTRLRVTFPETIPTHSRTQVFYFDARWRLARLDYTAEVVGGWAKAAHTCEAYRDFGGLRAPTRRRVWPRFFRDAPARAPLLVAIDIHDIRPQRSDAAGAKAPQNV